MSPFCPLDEVGPFFCGAGRHDGGRGLREAGDSSSRMLFLVREIQLLRVARRLAAWIRGVGGGRRMKSQPRKAAIQKRSRWKNFEAEWISGDICSRKLETGASSYEAAKLVVSRRPKLQGWRAAGFAGQDSITRQTLFFCVGP